jgi:purine nucleosidase
MRRLVIDTDPGVDDAQALMLALTYPQAQVAAITTVGGNVSVERTTANALKILDVCERDVPVFAGCERPLISRHAYASYVHGEDGLGNTNYPPSPRRAEAEHAVHALIRLADESPGELTLVAIGPLTNVAMAVRLDPGLPEKFARLVIMGGAIRAMGNAQNVSAEFNIYTDPEAGAIVFDAWKEFTLISWETTMAYALTPQEVDLLGSRANPRSVFFKQITQCPLAFIEQVLGRKALFAPDSLAVAVALEPDIVTAEERHHIQVEIAPGHTRGQTTVDWFGSTRREPNARIVLGVDRERFWGLLDAAVR